MRFGSSEASSRKPIPSLDTFPQPLHGQWLIRHKGPLCRKVSSRKCGSQDTEYKQSTASMPDPSGRAEFVPAMRTRMMRFEVVD